MEPTTNQTTGANPVTAAPAAAPAPTPTPVPQSLDERVASYKNTPGQFADSPLPTEAPPVVQPVPGEPDLESEDVPAEIKSEAAKNNFRALREKAKSRDRAAKELEEKLKVATQELDAFRKAPKSTVDPAEVEAIRKERDEYSEQLKALDIERHPKFQAAFKQKADQALASIKSIGGSELGPKLAQLAQLPESDYRTAQIEEIISKLPVFNQVRIGAAFGDYEKVNAERTEELNKAKAKYDTFVAIQREQSEQTQKQQQAQREAYLAAELEEAQKHLPIFQKRDGDEKHNKEVEGRINAIRTAHSNLTDREIANALIWQKTAPDILRSALAATQENAVLQKELAALKAATPRPGGGGDPKPGSAMPEGLSFSDRVVWQAKQSGAVLR